MYIMVGFVVCIFGKRYRMKKNIMKRKYQLKKLKYRANIYFLFLKLLLLGYVTKKKKKTIKTEPYWLVGFLSDYSVTSLLILTIKVRTFKYGM